MIGQGDIYVVQGRAVVENYPNTEYYIGAGLTGLDLKSHATWPKANN